MAEDEGLARSLSEQGFAKVEQLFNQEQNINELLALFDEYTANAVLPASAEMPVSGEQQDDRRAA